MVNALVAAGDRTRSAGEIMKLNLQKDTQKLLRYIRQRIVNYPVYINLGPGNDEDPIALITFGYYIFQTGYFAMVFDTRPDADSDGTGRFRSKTTPTSFISQIGLRLTKNSAMVAALKSLCQMVANVCLTKPTMKRALPNCSVK